MDATEAGRFLNRYKAIAASSRLPQLVALTTVDEFRRFRTPFFYGLYSFEEEFTHVGDYVRAHVADVPETTRDVVGLLALASRFSQEGILDSFVLKLLGLSERSPFRLTQLFGLSFPRILRVEERRVRFAHPLLAQEGLRQIYGENWSERLADLACEFLEKCVAAAGPSSAALMRLLTGMFIARDFWGDESERKRQFSELVLTIQNEAGQHRVLEKLRDLCPQEAHFWNHLGRHHMYVMRSEYHKTEACLLKAIELDEDNSIHHHALAMAYRFEIRRRLGALRRRSDTGTAIESVRDLYQKASAAFGKVRTLAPTDEHGYITHIQLVCEIIQQLFRISAAPDYGRLLAEPSPASEWCRVELNEAEDLLRRVKALQPPNEYSDMTVACQAKVQECYGRFESMINSLKLLLVRGGVFRAPVRRMLANAHYGRQKYLWHKTSSTDLASIRDLMLENLEEDEPRERDLLMWFQAARRLPDFDDLEAIDRFSRWAVRQPSADAYYYLYILHFIRFRQKITADYRNVMDSIDRCQSLHVRSGRPRSYEWLAKAPTWFPVAHESELGEWDYARNRFTKTEALATIDASIKRIKGPQSGSLALGPLDVFFVPGSEFLPGRDEGAQVTAQLGFSYEGLRAWGVVAADGRGAAPNA